MLNLLSLFNDINVYFEFISYVCLSPLKWAFLGDHGGMKWIFSASFSPPFLMWSGPCSLKCNAYSGCVEDWLLTKVHRLRSRQGGVSTSVSGGWEGWGHWRGCFLSLSFMSLTPPIGILHQAPCLRIPVKRWLAYWTAGMAAHLSRLNGPRLRAAL